ncbi:hypothetical protein HY490_02265 [Candidatus Woesearchaeota archaeon]|nr:hypothetical protein [Candidatus Woesearchaeota archaeon]
MVTAIEHMASATNTLYDVYHQHYHYTRVIRAGKTTHVQHYWTVPEELPHQDVVRAWQDDSSALREKMSSVRSEPAMNASDNIDVVCRSPNFWGKLAITGAVYGPLAITLLGYEEALEKMDVIRDAQQGMSRRNFLKLGAATIGVLPAGYYQNTHADRSDEAVHRVQTAVNDIVQSVRTKPSEVIFAQVLGYTPHDLHAFVSNMNASARDGARKECHQDIQQGFVTLNQAASSAQEDLESLLPMHSVPAELDRPLRHYWGRQKLAELNSSEKVEAYTNPLSECAVIAGIVAAVCVGNEVLMQKGL